MASTAINLTTYDTNFTIISRAVFEVEVYWDLKQVLTVVAFFVLLALVCSIIFLAIALFIFYTVSQVLITKGKFFHYIKFEKEEKFREHKTHSSLRYLQFFRTFYSIFATIYTIQ